jgi:NADH:ubiquinone oxidoreductase subunit K
MIGIFGILINRQNVLVILMAIELMLLGTNP